MFGVHRLRPAAAKAYDALLANVSADHYGYELMKTTGLKSGSLYPILRRLESYGWVEQHSEPSPHPGRPRRKVYRVTAKGERAMAPLLAEFEVRVRQVGLA